MEETGGMAETVLLMERDRTEQYQAALDVTERRFEGVFRGITGRYGGKKLSIVYSIGPAHVADCVSFLVQGYNVKRLIATGSIGGLSTDMGDVIVTNECATQDGYSLTVFGDEVTTHSKLGRMVKLGGARPIGVSETAQETLRRAFACNVHTGPVFTVPAVSVEDQDCLVEIKRLGYVALDLETGPFLSACRRQSVSGACVHWVTDLPLQRDFYYKYHGDPDVIEADWNKKHRQWLNMPRMILPLVDELMIEE